MNSTNSSGPVLIGGSSTCPTCTLCQDFGWVSKQYKSSRQFKNNETNEIALGVKDFLVKTTSAVCKHMDVLSSSQIKALKPRYRQSSQLKGAFKPSSLGSNRANKTPLKAPTPKNAISTISTKKKIKKVQAIESTPAQEQVTSIELPTITQLLSEETGLMGVLQSDILHIFNTYFGSNATVACKILFCLSNG
jgi:hypothetical protein